MTVDEKRNMIWKLALERAIGCSHPDPYAYADKKAKEWMPASPPIKPVVKRIIF